MQNKKKIKILAIDPGTQAMGYAYLENEDLVDYGVKYLRIGKRLEEMYIHLADTVIRFLKEKQPCILALEKNNFSHASQNAGLVIAISKIKGISKKHKIPFVEYAPRTIKKAVCNDGNAVKLDVSKVLVTIYPELKYYIGSDKRCKEVYFQNIFDAIACGKTHFKLNYKICQKGIK